MINANPDFIKCKGQAMDGTLKCAYRDRCARFKSPAAKGQKYEKFYLAGDDCPKYESLNRGL